MTKLEKLKAAWLDARDAATAAWYAAEDAYAAWYAVEDAYAAHAAAYAAYEAELEKQKEKQND